jgi:hypothetical protein
MFRYQVNSSSLNSSIEEKIEVGKIPNFFFVLNKKLANYRIIVICIIIGEIIKSHSRLKKQGFTKHIMGKVNRVSGQKLGNIENIILLTCFLVQKGIV